MFVEICLIFYKNETNFNGKNLVFSKWGGVNLWVVLSENLQVNRYEETIYFAAHANAFGCIMQQV